MGVEDLLTALRSEGERQAGVIRQEAEAEAARLKDEAAARLDRLKEEFQREQVKVITAAESDILAEAERTARKIQLVGTEKLAERLYDLALRLLPRLREKDYPKIFSRLVAELPPAEWESIRINPADAKIAGYLFPKARIEPDVGICGGMEALAVEGRVQVVNTLEKRLERAWPELLPVLLEEIESGA